MDAGVPAIDCSPSKGYGRICYLEIGSVTIESVPHPLSENSELSLSRVVSVNKFSSDFQCRLGISDPTCTGSVTPKVPRQPKAKFSK